MPGRAPTRRAHPRRAPTRRAAAARRSSVADDVLEAPQETVLDLLDHLLNKGVMLTGDVTLGVARVDLIYLRLSSLLCAADRVMPRSERVHSLRTRPPLLRRSRS
jgi:hypothetical protein